MSKLKSITFAGHTYTGEMHFRIGKYGNGDTAVQIFITEDLYEELLVTVSINLEAYGIRPTREDSFYIKSYSENEGLREALLAAGAIRLTGEIAVFGPYNLTAWEAVLTDEFKEH